MSGVNNPDEISWWQIINKSWRALSGDPTMAPMIDMATFERLASAIDKGDIDLLHNQLSLLHICTVMATENTYSCCSPITSGDTPLIYAARAGSLDAVKCIIEYFTDQTCLNNFSTLDTVEELDLIRGYSWISDEKVTNSSPLLRVYFSLLDWTNSVNDTALSVASFCGHLEIVKYLLENGAGLFQCKCLATVTCPQADQVCWHGFRALIQAGKAKHQEIIRYLVSVVPDINAKDRHGKNAILYYTCFTCVEILEAVLEVGADIDEVSKCGWTALMVAVVINKHDMVECLLRNGANPNHFDIKGNSALILSLQWSNEPLEDVRNLLRYGAYATVKNFAGYSTLMCAHSAELAEELLRNGARIGINLHFAVIMGRLDVVRMMLRYGAAPAVRDITGLPSAIHGYIYLPNNITRLSPLHAAILCGHTEIVRYFCLSHFYTECDLQLLWDRNILQIVDERYEPELVSVICSFRRPLLTLTSRCFITVSEALGDDSDREKKIKALGLPDMVKQRLLYFDDWSF